MAQILLADCDQMFVTVARLVDPTGAGRATLLVVGGAPGSRGVVCSASYEVRAFGVRSGMSIARAQRLCPQATFVPVPTKACRTKSREVRVALDRWTPVVEAASIDEFYLDLSGTEALYHHRPLDQVAQHIRDDVQRRTGMRLSIGGGSNRLIAKLAAERAKPRPGTGGTGVLIVAPGEEATFLSTHQLAEIPGVGPKLQQKLARFGLRSVTDALPIAERQLVSWLGPRAGPWFYNRIRGIGSGRVEPRGEQKSMSREATFAVDLATLDALQTELLRLSTRVAADLRAAELTTRCITVKYRTSDFETRVASKSISQPTDADQVVYRVASDLLTRLYRSRPRPARLVGVALSRLESVRVPIQLSLLDADRQPPDRAVSLVVDQINRRLGPGAVAPARILRKRRS